MFTFSCNCKSDCTSVSVIASIIVGIITAILTFTATITVTPIFLWVLFGIAVLYLAILLGTTNASCTANRSGCACKRLTTLIVGILGTVLTSLILLAVTFAATSVLGAILTGVLLFFFFLTLTATVCLVRCKAGCASCEELA